MGQKRKMSMRELLDMLKDIVNTLGDDQKGTLLRRLNAAQMRYEDKNLNLAIIGEFSCGKSTFINALFGQEILATSMMPTTAVPTYITWNNKRQHFHYGDYAITIHDSDGKAYDLFEDMDRKAFEKRAGINLPVEAERTMDAVTTNNNLTNVISKVMIDAPVRDRYKGICLIDTPGVNPGTEGTAKHVRITQEVLRDAADAAMIMFPADQVYTASFGTFLEENASHLLKHSIFVITKSDRIGKEQDLNALVEFVSGHLVKLGVEKPEIHCISAAYALDSYLSGDELIGMEKKKAEKWVRAFEKTIDEIFMDLASRRNAIVHENVTALAEQMTLLLTDSQSAQKAQLDGIRRDLEVINPQKMEEECRKIQIACVRKMESRLSTLVNAAPTTIGAAVETTKNGALEGISLAAKKDVVNSRLSEFEAHALDEVKGAIHRTSLRFREDLRPILQQYRVELEACYHRYHVNISNKEVNTLSLANAKDGDVGKIDVTVGGIKTGNGYLESMGAYVGDIFDADSLGEGLLMTAVGALMLPFAVVGGIVAALRPLNSVKEEARNKVSNVMESVRGQACETLKQSMTSIYEEFSSAAKDMHKITVKVFSAEFQQAEHLFRFQMDTLNTQILQLEQQLAQLRMIDDQLKRIRPNGDGLYKNPFRKILGNLFNTSMLHGE